MTTGRTARHLRSIALRSLFLFTFLLLLCAPAFCQATTASEPLVYVGTYTEHGSKGIYVYRFDTITGKLSSLGLAAESVQPSFVATDPLQKFLFAVNETQTFQNQPTGSVTSYAINHSSGKLTYLDQTSSGGQDPAHLTVDRSGKYLLVANYTSGNVKVFPIEKDGHLGAPTAFVQHKGSSVDADRQAGPHAHEIVMSPDNRFALVADLGLDEVIVYPFNKTNGTLGEPHSVKVKPGAGPRHLAFHPNGKFVYLANEMQSSVVTFSYDAATGNLHELQTLSTLPKTFKGQNTVAEIVADKSGRHVYVSNRGDDSIAIFTIDPAKGTLREAGFVSTGGKEPRNFTLDPSGNWLLAANQNSNDIITFRVSPVSGHLTREGQPAPVLSPVCILFLPSK